MYRNQFLDSVKKQYIVSIHCSDQAVSEKDWTEMLWSKSSTRWIIIIIIRQVENQICVNWDCIWSTQFQLCCASYLCSARSLLWHKLPQNPGSQEFIVTHTKWCHNCSVLDSLLHSVSTLDEQSKVLWHMYGDHKHLLPPHSCMPCTPRKTEEVWINVHSYFWCWPPITRTFMNVLNYYLMNVLN